MGINDGPGPWNADEKKSLQTPYLNISEEYVLAAIDMMRFEAGQTEIRVRK
jgi:hypothetical protein